MFKSNNFFCITVLGGVLLFSSLQCMDQTKKALNQEEQGSVLGFCKSLAERVGLPDATFILDGEYQIPSAYAYYNRRKGHISLRLDLQESILKTTQDSQSCKKSPSTTITQEKLTYDTETVLHELGHSQSSSIMRYFLISTAGLAMIQPLTSKKYLVCLMPIIACGVRLSQFFEERYADTFAIRKMCDLFGFERTRDYLKNDIRPQPSYTELSKGYRSTESLLRYVDKLEEWSNQDQVESSFYLNYSL